MSKKLYILAPYPKSQAPSQRFRFEQYLDLLEQHGFILAYHPFWDEKSWRKLYQPGQFISKTLGLLRAFLRRWVLLFKLIRADYVFIHREAAHIGPPVFEWIIAKVLRKKIIYDFDDAIWLPNYSDTNATFHRLKAYWKVRFIIKWSYRISAGNNYLANYAKQYNSNVTIIPTTIDLDKHHNVLSNHTHENVVIGWTGTHTTMRYLLPLLPVLKRLEQTHAFTFTVISNEAPNFELASLQFVKWNKETEIADLSRFHIGVMPLEKDIWAEGKCGFKGLQYMALGIAAVMSPVGVNTTIVENGVNGMLAETEEEWYHALKSLLENQALRKQMGEQGRKRVQEAYSTTAIGPVFVGLFE